MSVIMTLKMKGDPSKLEELAAADPDRISAISSDAKQYGVIAHRFYGSDSGDIMVIDEWPDQQSFESFFGANQERIQPLMADVGVQSEPEVTFWRKLESHDEIGWEE